MECARAVRLRVNARPRPGRRRLRWHGAALAAAAVTTAIAALVGLACSDAAPTGDASGAPQSTAARSGQGPPAETLALGAELYAQHCLVCHGDRAGEGNNGVAPLHNEQGHTFHHPDAQLKDIILGGKPPGLMPAFAGTLTEPQVDAILTLIKSWWTAADLEAQQDISRRYQEALDNQKKGNQ
jgi:mono/diheme cytochrome c family protein